MVRLSRTAGAGSSAEGTRAGQPAISPSALTPSLPFSLQSSIAGVPGFFIESFRIPPFLLPIFQAAGTAYGVPWQVLAAINEVETDYGTNLDTSSAGAIGWMQFMPATWTEYAVPVAGQAAPNPYDPRAAIYAAAHLLAANGDAVNADVLHPSEIVEFTRHGQFVREYNVDSAQGGAFGLDTAAHGAFNYAVIDDVTNNLTVSKVRD